MSACIPTDLDAVRALLANTTPSPWLFDINTYEVEAVTGALVAEAETKADGNLIAQTPTLLAALADEVEQARAILADPRVARTLKQIRQTEDEAVDFINASPYRADIVARLSELSDGQPRPYDGGIDRTLLRLGLDCGGPDTIVANTSVARVLARLTSEPTP
jgi:hypothetical protein